MLSHALSDWNLNIAGLDSFDAEKTIDLDSMLYSGKRHSHAINWNMNRLISCFGTFCRLRWKRRWSRLSCSEMKSDNALTVYFGAFDVYAANGISCAALRPTRVYRCCSVWSHPGQWLQRCSNSGGVRIVVYVWIWKNYFKKMIETCVDGCE